MEEGRGAEVTAYAPTAVLEREHVAQWLRVSPELVDSLPIRSASIGNGQRNRRRRWLAQWVIDYLEGIAV